MRKPSLSDVLGKYIPRDATQHCADFIVKHSVKVKITKNRFSKYGDYQAPHNGLGHIITINHNLNKYAFLITLLHEFAHLVTHVKYKYKNILPHGREWKHEYHKLLTDYCYLVRFPKDILEALDAHACSPKAASCTDLHLQRVLRKYDSPDAGSKLLEELPDESLFLLNDGRKFKKGDKLRTRYKCIDMKTRSTYFISAVAEVTPL